MQSYKKTLRITGVAAALLLAGCQKSLFPGIPRYMREPGGLSRLAGSDQEPNNSKHLYITALDNSQAVLYMDGKETVRSPAEHDPERLRVRDGHLWTDVIQGKETVVFRDGKEWLRFPGEEVLTGFLLRA